MSHALSAILTKKDSDPVNCRIRGAIDGAERGEAGSLLAATQNCNVPAPIAVVSLFCDGEHFVRDYVEFVETTEVSGVIHINYRQFIAVHGCIARNASTREMQKVAEKFSTMPKKTSRTNGDVTIHLRRVSPSGGSPRFAAEYTYRREIKGDEIFFPVGKDGREGLTLAKQIKKDIDRGMSKRELLERYHPRSRLLKRIRAAEGERADSVYRSPSPSPLANCGSRDTALVSAVKDFLKTKSDRAPNTIRQNRDILKRFVAFNGREVPLSSICRTDTRAYLESIPKGSRKAHLTIIKGFLKWAIEEELIEKNPCQGITPPRQEYKEVAVLTLDEVGKLLDGAVNLYEGELIAYAALSIFGALRPDSEMSQLCWGDINLADHEIVVRKGKRCTPRTITMPENLMEWLRLCDQTKPIFPESFRKKWGKIKVRAGFKSGLAKSEKAKAREKGCKRWIRDLTRHTAISHFLRECGDKTKTATWAGTSVSKIETNYMGRVTGSETERFWEIRPS